MGDVKLDKEEIFSVQEDTEVNLMSDNDSLSTDYSNRDNMADSQENVSNGENVDTVISFLFKLVDEAQSFYTAYERETGFDVCKQACKNEMPKCNACISNKNKKHGRNCNECEELAKDQSLWIVKNCEWVCSREGFRRKAKPGYVRQRRAKPDRRCGCLASFRVSHDRFSNMYKVTRFVRDHNHPLEPNDANRHLQCNRYLAPSDKTSLTLLTEIGMRPCVLRFMEHLMGGAGKLSFNRKDAYNYLYKQHQEMIINGDMNTAIRYLEDMRSHCQGMIYKYTIDDEGVLTKLFWCDGMSRAEFNVFGDVLVFDSTYRTNKYKFPLVMLSGVNNHGNTCVFAAAFLQNETLESYQWLLQMFRETMSGKTPIVVLTDQDASMRAAILSEFPNARHRLCSWHLARNASSKVGHAFASGFAALMHRRCSEEQFNVSWEKLIEHHDVGTNCWVVETYEKRHLWAEAFFHGVFTAGMTTTGRSESMNSLIKLAAGKQFTITDFLKHYHRTLQRIRNEFFQKQEACEKLTPVVRESPLKKLEMHAAKICTKKAFYMIQEQIEVEQRLIQVKMIEISKGSHEFSFDNCNKPDGEVLLVKIEEGTERFLCECMMLESKGIPCCHIISAFKSLRLDKFPPGSINPRWMIDAGRRLKIEFKDVFPPPNAQRTRFAEINKECLNLCFLGSQTDSAFASSLNCVKQAAKEADEAFRNQYMHDLRSTEEDIPAYSMIQLEQDVSDPSKYKAENDLHDPVCARSKGGVRAKKQKCGVCRVPGHKASTCPSKESQTDCHTKDVNNSSNHIGATQPTQHDFNSEMPSPKRFNSQQFTGVHPSIATPTLLGETSYTALLNQFHHYPVPPGGNAGVNCYSPFVFWGSSSNPIDPNMQIDMSGPPQKPFLPSQPHT